jgi:hypothetical protein
LPELTVTIPEADRFVIIDLLTDIQGHLTYPDVWRAVTTAGADDAVRLSREHAEELYQFARNRAHGAAGAPDASDPRIVTACARVAVTLGRALGWIAND